MSKLKPCLFLLPVLLLALPLELMPQETEAAGTAPHSESTLNRLIEISTQLLQLNEKLEYELTRSRQNSYELESLLHTSRAEIDVLREALEVSLQTSNMLQNAAENSLVELNSLAAALRIAESSLTNLEHSFAGYRKTAENKIVSLQRRNRLLKWGCIAAGVLVAGFGAAAAASR